MPLHPLPVAQPLVIGWQAAPHAGGKLPVAGSVGDVEPATFFHGGDEIYALEGIPGVWHEECLSAV